MTDTMRSMVVDTHLHFWDLATYQDHTDWMKDSPVIFRSFLPEDIKPHFHACGVDRGVIIEAARDSHALNLWWLALAKRYPYIGAVVAGCLLEQADLAGWFDEYAHSPYFVGVRTAPAGPPENWATDPDTARGLNELARRDLSLDLLVTYEAFEAVRQVAAKHPSLRIILDHCGGPPLREGQLDAWRQHLAPLAGQPNIHVKYSSLLLYAEPDISVERIRPVAEFLMETFGPQRLLWGSNWPVELMGGTYEQSFSATHAALQPLTTAAEREAIYGGNAAKFYHVR
jgi:L-fuconolactonase